MGGRSSCTGWILRILKEFFGERVTGRSSPGDINRVAPDSPKSRVERLGDTSYCCAVVLGLRAVIVAGRCAPESFSRAVSTKEPLDLPTQRVAQFRGAHYRAAVAVNLRAIFAPTEDFSRPVRVPQDSAVAETSYPNRARPARHSAVPAT